MEWKLPLKSGPIKNIMNDGLKQNKWQMVLMGDNPRLGLTHLKRAPLENPSMVFLF